MGMSTHAIGFKPPDATWKKMKDIWDACTAANIDVPHIVEKFFNGEPPDEAGVEVDLGDALKKHLAPGESGFDVEIAKLDPTIKIIRFYNSW